MKDSEKNKKYPHTRITEAARMHVQKLVKVLKSQGHTSTSMTKLVSDAILSIPIPPTEPARGESEHAN